MRRLVSHLSLGFLIILLAACASAPKNLPRFHQPKLANSRVCSFKSASCSRKGVDRDELKDTWGARSQGRSHEGIDILAPRGTKVYSATEGLIADLRNNNLGGKVIWILGPAGTWHYYAHLDGHKRGLNVGDYVKRATSLVMSATRAMHVILHLIFIMVFT